MQHPETVSAHMIGIAKCDPSLSRQPYAPPHTHLLGNDGRGTRGRCLRSRHQRRSIRSSSSARLPLHDCKPGFKVPRQLRAALLERHLHELDLALELPQPLIVALIAVQMLQKATAGSRRPLTQPCPAPSWQPYAPLLGQRRARRRCSAPA